MPADECLRFGLLLADALGALHREGLAHRDIKPSNIIFVEGVPKLADIGLVATSGQRSFVGTEGYVPPEGPGTPQADIYSLGKVLYEISMGKDRLDFPELSSNLDERADKDRLLQLNEVLLKACANNPADVTKTPTKCGATSRGSRPGSPDDSPLARMVVPLAIVDGRHARDRGLGDATFCRAKETSRRAGDGHLHDRACGRDVDSR